MSFGTRPAARGSGSPRLGCDLGNRLLSTALQSLLWAALRASLEGGSWCRKQGNRDVGRGENGLNRGLGKKGRRLGKARKHWEKRPKIQLVFTASDIAI